MRAADPDLKQRFEHLSRKWWPEIARLIEEVVDGATTEGSLLREMARYHQATGGKRLRAILPLLIAQALAADPGRVVPFGAACEMLHNASLVHDDVQDADGLRRGQLAVWRKFGVAQAINLGDAMIAYAVLLMQRLEAPTDLRERAVRRLLLEMLRVIEGQVQDLALKRLDHVTLDDYLAMVEGKTSRLFALPLSGAAALCGASPALEQGLAEAACQIGVLFQVQDDLMDALGPESEAGGDIREGKLTILACHCLNAAPAERARWLWGVLQQPPDCTSGADIAAVIALYHEIGSVEFALGELSRRRDAALSIPALAACPPLVAVLTGACDLFVQPIWDLLGNARPADAIRLDAPVAP